MRVGLGGVAPCVYDGAPPPPCPSIPRSLRSRPFRWAKGAVYGAGCHFGLVLWRNGAIIWGMRYSRRQLKRFAREMRNNPTDVEFALWQRLRTRRLDGYRFVRQYVIDGAIVDFACPQVKLAIELDGGQHDERRALDDLRTERLNRAGYKVVRFWNDEVMTNIEGVLIVIREALRARG